MTPQELRQKRAAVLAEARKIIADAGENVTDEQRSAADALIAKANQLGADADRIELVDSAIAASRQSAGRVADPLPHNDPSNTREGRHSYSIVKAIREKRAQLAGEGRGLTGLELETHLELDKIRQAEGGPASRGFLVPHDLSVDPRLAARGAASESRAFDTSAGTGSIFTAPGSLIDLLRARMVLAQSGATIMSGVQGNFSMPRQSGGGTFYMVAEAGSPTASAQTVDQVAFSPKTGGAYTDYTRRLLAQSSLDVENFVRSDLAAIVARGVETQVLNGSGSGNNLTGLVNDSSVPTVALGTDGLIPTWASLVALESKVAVANADMGSLRYITNASVRGILKTTPKIGSTFPVFLWDEGPNPINGYAAGITNIVPNTLSKGASSGILSAILFGNWNDLVIPFWSGLDVIIDPYSLSTSGGTRIVALQDFHFAVRHYESFAKIIDAKTA